MVIYYFTLASVDVMCSILVFDVIYVCVSNYIYVSDETAGLVVDDALAGLFVIVYIYLYYISYLSLSLISHLLCIICHHCDCI